MFPNGVVNVERLEAMGRWLDVNGESIYSVVPGPLQGLGWARTTANPDTIFLHVFDWPEGGKIEILSVGASVTRAALLSNRAADLPITEQGDTIIVQGPAKASDAADSVIALELEN